MRYNVLIADDEVLILRNLTQIINWESLGCRVIGQAANGNEAMKILQEEKVDLLLTDISMPGMTGIELLKWVNEMEHKPISILLSGYDEFEYAREGMKYNALDYFLKPIDYDELESCIIRGIDRLKEIEENKLKHEKHVFYELLTTGLVSEEEVNKQLPYIALCIKSQEENADDEAIQQFQKFFSEKHIKSFFYKLTEEESIGILEFSRDSFEDTIEEGYGLIKDIYSHIPHAPVVAIGRPVDCLYKVKQSADHARKLMKFSSFVESKLVTEDELKKEYTPSRQSVDVLMTKAVTYIKNHFQEDLGMEQVAEQVDLSSSHFSMLFKQKTGSTFLEFLTDLRVESACFFLDNSELKTYEIAEKVGYSDQRYFSQVFKRKMGMTPSMYRKMNKES